MRSQQPSFLESIEVPPQIYRPLLSWLFDTPEFQQWLIRGHSWQLRIFGEPGSGKTTLSAMTVNHLRTMFRGQNMPVLSAFLTPAASDDNNLVHRLLQSILGQLSSHANEVIPIRDPSMETTMSNGIAKATVEQLRQQLYACAAKFTKIFLILDDIDLCSQGMATELEKELTALQLHRFSIMVTSRLSIWHQIWINNCDINPDHAHLPAEFCWYCANCYDEIAYEEDQAKIICQMCIENYVCPTCDLTPNLREPYQYVDYNLRSIPNHILQAFVAREIELEHGNLGLNSGIEEDVPLSRLGRVLVASRTENGTSEAERFRDRIVEDSTCNISLAKLRLEAYRYAQSLEEITRYGDRLPDNIVSVFDAAIRAIERKPVSDRDTALKAISGAATDQFYAKPFEKLENWIYHQTRRESTSRHLPRRYKMEEILRATNGLINVSHREDSEVQPYQAAFTVYVAESYNSSLYWIRTSMSDMDEQGFARPRRVQTWQVAAQDLEIGETLQRIATNLTRTGSIRILRPLRKV